ncbi:hypothetical protein PHJA_000145300 [Phtheirospermum japonicum]|uniref:S-protein homolog n=1 Tax=Phtheirospermum japonicum TaxID=374723 RepID=A0A830B3W2_9LAMI|nr:hypothetical protein PHJA_000145300 [Phtheirospermum japonicum]
MNNLPSNYPPLNLRCKSKNDDLGYHTLLVNQDFHWSFCQNIFGKTLFFCHLYWGSKQRAFVSFSSKHRSAPSFQLYWSARKHGIYLNNFNDTNIFGRTLFFCHLYWGSKQKAFDSFRSQDLKAPWFQFYWSARSDGIYLNYFNDTPAFVKNYDWN